MAILTKGQTFADGDDVTHTKLNNLVDNAAFVSGSSGTTDDSSLEVNGSGRLQIKDSGVTTGKINASAVTTAKLANSTATTDGVTFAKIRYMSDMTVIGNVSGGATTPAEVSILDEDDMSSDSATSLATQQSIKAYVDTEIAAAVTTGTAVATTSGTSVDFTSLPAAIKRLTVIFKGVSLSGTSDPIIQLGTSGGLVTSSYQGGACIDGIRVASSTGFQIHANPNASEAYTGLMTMYRLEAGSNDWIISGVITRDSDGQSSMNAGRLALGGELTRLRVTTAGGSDTFDAGSLNISYE